HSGLHGAHTRIGTRSYRPRQPWCPPPGSALPPPACRGRRPGASRYASPHRTRWPCSTTASAVFVSLHAFGISSTFTADGKPGNRSEEHTSELQSRFDLVCRLLLEKKKHKCF